MHLSGAAETLNQ